MAKYRRGAHTLYDIEYHFVWVTKYRYQVLKGEVAVRTRELIRQTCLSREIKIIKGHVSKDHVHVLLSCPPKLSPSQIMQYLKGKSSRILQQEFPHLKKRYWGRHIWARGYFCASVGAVSKEPIKAYIENHDKSLSKRASVLKMSRLEPERSLPVPKPTHRLQPVGRLV